ncbi:unnamed protein product [Blepharisma stoltei]|uniref:F-box domain-containing protein n=1 Tax=Blepharisma stoltei TaxID=1481888 RepID=A0AAU9KGY1_9CILI|nr:unnamed protein product [Blepharisma stoltei]
MEYFPYEILGEIMIFLGPKEVFLNFCLINKYFNSVTNSPYHLSRLVSNKLHITRPISLSPFQAIKILKATSSQSKINSIKFIGFGTTGGVDDDNPNYWVDSLFSKKSRGYCSRENTSNVNCAGVLSSTQTEILSDGRAEIKNEVARIVRNNKYARQLLGLRRGRRSDSLNYFEEMVFRHIFINNPEVLVHRNSNQQLMYEHMHHLRDLHDTLVCTELKLANFRKSQDDLYTLVRQINFQAADRGNKLFVAKMIEISRSGHFTCPVAAFMVFVSDAYVDIDSYEFSIYNDLKSSDDIDNLISIDGRVPEAYSLVKEKLHEYRLFKWTNNPLKPILWGRFIKRGRKNMEVKLCDAFSGVYLYMKLFYPLNLMREFGDMGSHTNIDARYVGIKGVEITI